MDRIESPRRLASLKKVEGVPPLPPRKKRSKNKTKERNRHTNSNSKFKELRSKSSKLQRKEDLPRQVSEKTLNGQTIIKKPADTIGLDKIRIQNSRQILKEIEMEKVREEARKQQLEGLNGIEARRLQKIHMIERIEAQMKLSTLRSVQEGVIQTRLTRGSFV